MMVRGKATVEAKADRFKGEPQASGTERHLTYIGDFRFREIGEHLTPHAEQY